MVAVAEAGNDALYGDVVCVFGCGNGYHTLKLAKRAGEDGRVFGVDIQPKMLKLLNERAEHNDIDNISPGLETSMQTPIREGIALLLFVLDIGVAFAPVREIGVFCGPGVDAFF